jgi:succinate dehydrogenase/fumarate reductase cytochrome b subunit
MQRSVQFWLLPLSGAITYPALIILFPHAIDGYRQYGSPVFAAYAALLMLLAGSIPIIVARALIVMRHDSVMSPLLTRGMLYLMFAVSPLYVFTSLFARTIGLGQYHSAIWTVAWVAVGVMLYTGKEKNKPGLHSTASMWLRIIHGGTALTLLCGFLIAHVLNHGLAVWSVELHSTAMKWLRLWYRSEWAEPVLLVLLLVMISSGVPMVMNHSRRRTDAFRIVQMATGVYTALFLCAHLLAVLSARSAGVETDWIFATGPTGLVDGGGMLIPYYILAVFFLLLHVACGVRIVLLKHGVAEAIANRAVYGAAGISLVATALIAVAALGFHVQS